MRSTAIALALCLLASQAHAEDDYFIDASGQRTSHAEAYEKLTPLRPRAYWRQTLEFALLMSSGLSWYWIDEDRQVGDWTLPSIRERLSLDSWIYDSNPFSINFVWHAASGAVFHNFARSNNFGLLGASLWGLAASFVWEFGVEFKEDVSLNDVVFTSGSGIAIGEYFHWLGRYLSARRDGVLAGSLRWTAGFPYALHEALDGPAYDGVPGIDATASVAYQTSLLSRVQADKTLPLHGISATGDIVAMPGFLRPSRFLRWFGQANVSRVQFAIGKNRHDTQVQFLADTILLGAVRQSISQELEGTSTVFGVALGLDYRREQLGDWRDNLAFLHLPGLALDQRWLGPRSRLRASLRLHPDFAGVRALAHPAWRAENPDESIKLVLDREGYYYGWGLFARAELEWTLPWFRLTAVGALGAYDSHDGQDRAQEDITSDVDHDDRFAEGRLSLEVPIWQNLFGAGSFTATRRESRQAEFSQTQSVQAFRVSIGARF